MRKIKNQLVFAPTDLSGFLDSPFASWMNRLSVEGGEEVPDKDAPDALQDVLAKQGLSHEANQEQKFRDQGLNVVNIDEQVIEQTAGLRVPAAERLDIQQSKTIASMKAGVDVIAQATLTQEPFAGIADFLVKVDGTSGLGDYHYEVWDTKLARRVKPAFVIQLCCYADMLNSVQSRLADEIAVATGDEQVQRVKLADCFDYYLALKKEFLQTQGNWSAEQKPDPAESASHGRWSEHADELLIAIDHLSLVATITRSQIKKLERAGITTRAELAGLADPKALEDARNVHDGTFLVGTPTPEHEPIRIPGMDSKALSRLALQAALQVASDDSKEPAYRIINSTIDVVEPEAEPDETDTRDAKPLPPRGLSRLPPHSNKDVFFDIEGYPLVDGGLEYLWGCTYFDDSNERQFRDWWAHDSQAERVAFESFMDWVFGRWTANPGMHIYHYANYEIAACKKLTGRYGTREHELDTLLRNHVFVDLYLVVQQGMQIGEPRYSIKNIEKLYRPRRDTDVASGGDSVVVYEQWQELHQAGEEGDTWETSPTLKGIREYNIDDCDSTQELVAWLRVQQQENDIDVVEPVMSTEGVENEEITTTTTYLRDMLLAKAESYEADDCSVEGRRLETLAGLLEFHRREDKPMWWTLFERMANTAEALLDDDECLARCIRTQRPAFKPSPRARNLAYEYRFDSEQAFKSITDTVALHDELKDSGFPVTVKLLREFSDLSKGLVVLQMTFEPPVLTLMPYENINKHPIPKSIEYVIRQLTKDVLPKEDSGEDELDADELSHVDPNEPEQDDVVERKYAIADFLNRAKPRITGHTDGPIAVGGSSEQRLQSTIQAVLNLDNSYLAIQGPPGCGKSYTGERIIAALCQRGLRVGVASNSHPAIQNLVKGAARYLCTNGIEARFICTKKFDDLEPLGIEVLANAKLADAISKTPSAVVVGTTAWGFCRDDLVGAFDYLLIDEAGQVAVANLVGMSAGARNLVLLGDQMQLGQPSRGTHPVDSGLSVLDYLMQGTAVIESDRGVFLDTTYRMHSNVNSFVSERFYDGELRSEPSNDERVLEINSRSLPDELKREAGIVYLPVEHSGNTQGSQEEADAIQQAAVALIGQTLHEQDGTTRALDWADLMFVAPYNHQVRLLKETLGDKAKVGTVDKFQGQQAAICVYQSLYK